MRSYYVILGVPHDESAQGIRAAYRDRAKALHPDHAGPGHRQEFLKLQRAYEVLSDPSRRRQYDRARTEGSKRQGGQRPVTKRPPARPEPLVPTPPAEPLIPEMDRPISIARDFHTFRPSRDELWHRLRRNVADRNVPKSEHEESLTVELVLHPRQAAAGVAIPVGIPVFRRCPRCGGHGWTWSFSCASCRGQGLVEGEGVVNVRVPPGVRSGQVFEAPLTGLGISNLYLRVLIRVSA